ncbi:MAG TPA: PDC sensor domain-containing protein, partial [Bauldia sp.]|nr:PDC sensor domain-containing protein [Bauldia sp.]
MGREPGNAAGEQFMVWGVWLTRVNPGYLSVQITPRHILLGLSVALPLAAFVAASAYDYESVVDHAETEASSTADALAEHARAVLQTVNAVLGRVEDRISTHDWATLDKSEDIHTFLANVQQGLPETESIFLVNPQGYNSASSRMYPMPAYDDRDRDYYKDALSGDPDLF